MTGLFGCAAPSQEAIGTYSNLDFQTGSAPAPTATVARDKTLSVLPKGAWPIRDQRYRNTCVAFCATAALELFRAREKGDTTPETLSEDFLYNRMRGGLSQEYLDWVRSVLPDYELGATLLAQALMVQREIGTLTEAQRPYQQATPLFDIDGARPSESHRRSAARRKQAHFYYHKMTVETGMIDPGQAYPKPGGSGSVSASDAAYLLLKSGSAVAVGLPVYFLPDARMNWTAPATTRTGYVPYPGTDKVYDAALVVASGHAVCLTGYVPVTDAPGGGYFIFRNSWGLDFRTTFRDPVDGVSGTLVPPGYGVLSAAAVDKYVWEMMAPTKDGPMASASLP
ncbi:C1 family peptidase [Pseudaestuariivita atlantica]|uniref:Peptidase C1A papain C-terminal domain-containing protein n=1 Tax=Pseudaestuariivita atlantica TaxID=1317121 RepID=A0A0L1JNH2_9RHOB|nr:C1 family peptidase [Pseudaestuariivita atlantica]KNG93272.1 hypothetical protein ATO11_12530 [Pseudaestuariivita atlantica]